MSIFFLLPSPSTSHIRTQDNTIGAKGYLLIYHFMSFHLTNPSIARYKNMAFCNASICKPCSQLIIPHEKLLTIQQR